MCLNIYGHGKQLMPLEEGVTLLLDTAEFPCLHNKQVKFRV